MKHAGADRSATGTRSGRGRGRGLPTRAGAALLIVVAASACSVVGYPAGSPSGSPGGGVEPRVERGDPDYRRDGPPADPESVDLASIPDAEPRPEPLAPYGNMDEYEVFGETYRTLATSRGYEAEGVASWYGREFHGRPTSSGEPYDMYAMTAAHKTLPLPTYLEVVNLENGRRVVVRVNDRGPFLHDRLLDLSYAAAWKLGVLGAGTARVSVRALEPAAR